jgi:hypothetical protein
MADGSSNAGHAVVWWAGIFGSGLAASAALTSEVSLIAAGPRANRIPVRRNANKARNPAPRFMIRILGEMTQNAGGR